MSLEQEIKLQVSQKAAVDLDQFDWLTALLAAPTRRLHLLSTYYDTPALALKQFGAGLRLRRVGEQWFQTVKCQGQVDNGLHQRQEWEHELSEPVFNMTLLRQTHLAPLLDNPAVWSAIGPLFTTDFDRLILPLQLEDGSCVEMAYDRGEVRAGDRCESIHEIELELKQGELHGMLVLAERLKACLPLQYADTSKAAQGYALL